MERNIKISLEKAKEWYNSDNESLREVALQAFKKEELIEKPWEKIKSFEDACRILNINPTNVSLIPCDYLRNIYKLQIIKKALNGANWEPKLNTGNIYFPWLRYYPKDGKYDLDWTPIANFKNKEDNKVYTLVGGDYITCVGSLGNFGYGYGDVDTNYGLLGCKSEKIASYLSKTFGKLIFDATYGQYNNYIWID